MGHCKNCKYWGASFAGACDFVDTIQAEKGSASVQIHATAHDDSGLCSSLLTGPDFGCVHFEGKGIS